MPTFHYVAFDGAGRETTGSLEARTSIDAVNQLHRSGLKVKRLDAAAVPNNCVTSAKTAVSNDSAGAIESAGSSQADASRSDASDLARCDSPAELTEFFDDPPDSDERIPIRGVRFGTEDLAEIAGRIAGITAAELPLAPGLRLLSEEIPSPWARRGISVLCNRIEGGESLEGALNSGGIKIPRHIATLIVAGGRSGRLSEIMEWYLGHVRRRIDLRRRCQMALIYPVALLAAACSALLFGLLWIVPSVKHIFQDFGIDLPGITIALISLSNFVIDYGLYFFAALVIAACAIPLVLHALGGRPLRSRFKAGMPFVGTMFRCSSLSAFCELLAMFVTAHVALPEGVRMAAEGTGDADLELQFEPVAECVAQGQSDTELARRLANISPHLIHVFHWKTRKTNFVDALNAAAGVYENQAELQITLVSLLLEPVVIIGVLGGAALFVLALFYPLFSLLRSLA